MSYRPCHNPACLLCLDRRAKDLARKGLDNRLAHQLQLGGTFAAHTIAVLEGASPAQIEQLNAVYRRRCGEVGSMMLDAITMSTAELAAARAAYDANVEEIKSANTVLRETLDDLA